jgi:hypothetical protein
MKNWKHVIVIVVVIVLAVFFSAFWPLGLLTFLLASFWLSSFFGQHEG